MLLEYQRVCVCVCCCVIKLIVVLVRVEMAKSGIVMLLAWRTAREAAALTMAMITDELCHEASVTVLAAVVFMSPATTAPSHDKTGGPHQEGRWTVSARESWMDFRSCLMRRAASRRIEPYKDQTTSPLAHSHTKRKAR